MPRYMLGIDPDIDKCGLAFLQEPYKIENITLWNMTLWDIFEMCLYAEAVFLEAGWLNKKGMPFDGNIARAVKVGQNHEIGKQIYKYCQTYKKDCFLYKPVSEKWTHNDFAYITGSKLKKSNQEQRDAVRAMLQNSMFKETRARLMRELMK